MGAHFPGCVPPVPGLCAFTAADERRHGTASASGYVRRLCRWRDRRHSRNVSFGAGTGAGAHPLPAAGEVAPRRQRATTYVMNRLLKRCKKLKACATLALLLAAPSSAHVMSMSTGDLRIDDRRAHYELRMPLYEMSHVAGSAEKLFDHIRFSSGGSDARLIKKDCTADQGQGIYFCTAEYEFPQRVDILDVDCT